jgi:polysaccharide export outer membrane protein
MLEIVRNESWSRAARHVVVCALLLLSACAGNPEVTSVPMPSRAPEPTPSDYRIGPGDTLQVFVWNNPELTVTVPVRPDGKISTPLIDGVPAEGKTATQLARDLETALAEFVRNPTVSVMVTSFVGSYSEQVRVVGQAAKPQSMPFRANMTVLDVMIAVGGLAEFAAGNRAVLVRREGDKLLRIPLRLNDLLNKGDVNANMPVRPGDVLIIPESRF